MYPFLLISRRMSAVIAVALLLGVTSVPQAQAGYTAVRQPKRVTEPSHEQILARVYGGNVVADASGLNFSNESGVDTVGEIKPADAADAGATAAALAEPLLIPLPPAVRSGLGGLVGLGLLGAMRRSTRWLRR